MKRVARNWLHLSSQQPIKSLISAQDIETYQRDGVVLIKKVLSESQIEAGREAIADAIVNAGPHAEFIVGDSLTWEELQDSFGEEQKSDLGINEKKWTMFQDQFSCKRSEKMKSFIYNSPTAFMAATLMKSSTASFFYDHVICKRRTDSRITNTIPWHQDLPYWSVRGTFASVWIPFDEIPKESAVQWILQSHEWGLFQPRHFVDASPYKGTEHMDAMPDVDEMIASGKVRVQRFNVSPGDVLVFNAKIIHGSPGNQTTGTASPSMAHRRVALRFGGDDALYWKYDRETAIPSPDIIHGLSHGDKLTCDAFPCLWPL